MATARRKAPKLPVPDSDEEAIDLLGLYAQTQALIEGVEADRRGRLAEINAAADAVIAPLEEQLKDYFNQLKPWWAVRGDHLLPKDRRSMVLGSCKIGHRTTTPKLGLVKMTPEIAVATLKDHGWGDQCVRIKEELDRPAILTLLGGDHADQFKALGFKISQRDEFFIDPVPTKKPNTAVVAEPVEGEAA